MAGPIACLIPMPAASCMAEAVPAGSTAPLLDRRPGLRRLIQWGGAGALALSIGFIGERLWRLDLAQLHDQASWSLASAMLVATGLFGAADAALARGWAALADPAGQLSARQAAAIYGRGVLLKYLPGSVFQYLSRQIEGSGAGLPQRQLAGASVKEVALHLAASLSVAGCCIVAAAQPLLAGLLGAGLGSFALWGRSALLRAFGYQFIAFAGFAAAAAIVAAVLLPGGASTALFAALFLLAWLAGFVVPVAPGGIGVREAALLVLAGPTTAAAPLLAAVMALRVSSIAGDLLFGLGAAFRARSQ